MNAPNVAVIREEGSNGDREMIASLYMAGFQVWDVTMQDIVTRKITLDKFRGIVFPGGFSYAGGLLMDDDTKRINYSSIQLIRITNLIFAFSLVSRRSRIC